MTEDFTARMLAEFHRLVPEADVMLVPQAKRPSLFGVHAAQVERESAVARDATLTELAELWPVLTGGLPPPAAVRIGWEQASWYTSAVLAVATARYEGPSLDKVRRVEAAQQALAGAGWAVRRRDPRFPRYLRLLADRGRTAVEVAVRTRPDHIAVEVRHGPVLVGRYGADLLAEPAELVRFPVGQPPG